MGCKIGRRRVSARIRSPSNLPNNISLRDRNRRDTSPFAFAGILQSKRTINKILRSTRTRSTGRLRGLPRLRASESEKLTRSSGERCAALTIRSLCNIVMPFGSYRASYRWCPIPQASERIRTKGPGTKSWSERVTAGHLESS